MKTDRHTLLALLGCVLAAFSLLLFSWDLRGLESLNQFTTRYIGGDFYQFWAAGRLTAQGVPEGAYLSTVLSREAAQVNQLLNARVDGHLLQVNPLYYPPVYLLVLTGFGSLPFFAAYLAFFAATGTVFFLGLWQLLKTCWLLALLLGFAGIWVNLIAGQNGLLTAGLLAIALACLRPKPVLAGLCIGLMCYKPHLGLLLPLVLLVGGYWRVFFFASLTVLGLIAYTFIVLGFESWILWYEATNYAGWVLEFDTKLWQRMPTLYAQLRLSGFGFGDAILAQGAFSLLAAILTLWVWVRSRDFALRGAAIACGLLLVPPFVYDYDYAMLGVAFGLLVLRAERQGWRPVDKLLLPLAFVWPLLINRITVNSHEYTGYYLQIGFWLPLALLILVVARARPDRLEQRHERA